MVSSNAINELKWMISCGGEYIIDIWFEYGQRRFTRIYLYFICIDWDWVEQQQQQHPKLKIKKLWSYTGMSQRCGEAFGVLLRSVGLFVGRMCLGWLVGWLVAGVCFDTSNMLAILLRVPPDGVARILIVQYHSYIFTCAVHWSATLRATI